MSNTMRELTQFEVDNFEKIMQQELSEATRVPAPQGSTPAAIAPQVRVQVRHDQRRLGGPKYPGRVGVVVEENKNGRPEGLWYVRLEATKRAKERTECFWTRDLDILPS